MLDDRILRLELENRTLRRQMTALISFVGLFMTFCLLSGAGDSGLVARVTKLESFCDIENDNRTLKVGSLMVSEQIKLERGQYLTELVPGGILVQENLLNHPARISLGTIRIEDWDNRNKKIVQRSGIIRYRQSGDWTGRNFPDVPVGAKDPHPKNYFEVE